MCYSLRSTLCPWTVEFQKSRGAPESVRLTELLDLSMHPDDGVKFPSGPATCRSTFEFSPTDLTKPDSRVLLDLGGVEVPGG